MLRLAIAALAAALLLPAADASARQAKPTIVFVHCLIGRQDEVISPAGQRFMAKRAKAHTVEFDASHASYVSHPDAVTNLILRAARSVR